MPEKNLFNSEADEKFQALLSNANAARVVSQVVEGTIGPKGLDIMMVDRFGDVVISNDGVTILKLMEVTHPVARMIINTARAQQEEVGDGTTTATILAGALVAEGANQVMRGVPVTQVIKGIDIGIKESMALMKKYSRPVHTVEDPVLFEVACIAGRGDRELARLVLDGARIVGWERLQEKDYRLADAIAARAGAENRLFMGLLLNKEPVNQEMPRTLQQVSILVIDDALGPEEIDDGARSTEAGFQYYLQARERYEKSLQNICGLGVNLVLVDRSIDDTAEQIFTEAGIMVLQRVSQRDLEKVCKHTGARKIKRSALNRAPENLRAYLGKADRAEVDDRLKHTCIINGKGEKWATVIIGAATEEVVDERERIARDAAASVQAAARQGVIPGGGAMEVCLARHLEELAQELKGMSCYGVLCVKEALLRPFTCIISNAGFNPLEKLGDVIAGQKQAQSETITIDCDSGELINAISAGIVDPALVKMNAVKAGGEVAMAILRINTIIKMQESSPEDHDFRE